MILIKDLDALTPARVRALQHSLGETEDEIVNVSSCVCI